MAILSALNKNLKFANRAKAKLAAPISAIALEMSLVTGGGAAFMAAIEDVNTQWLEVYIINGNDFEIVGMWQDATHTGDNFVIDRSYYGTTAKAFPAGSDVICDVHANWFMDLQKRVFNEGLCRFLKAFVDVNFALANNTISNVTASQYAESYQAAAVNYPFELKVYSFSNFQYFRARAKIKFAPTAGGVRKAWLYQDIAGVITELEYKVIPGATDNEQTIWLESSIITMGSNVAVNDNIHVKVFQDSGAPLDVLLGSYLEIEWLDAKVVI